MEWAVVEYRKPACHLWDKLLLSLSASVAGLLYWNWKRRASEILETPAKGHRQWAMLEVRQEFVVGPQCSRPQL